MTLFCRHSVIRITELFDSILLEWCYVSFNVILIKSYRTFRYRGDNDVILKNEGLVIEDKKVSQYGTSFKLFRSRAKSAWCCLCDRWLYNYPFYGDFEVQNIFIEQLWGMNESFKSVWNEILYFCVLVYFMPITYFQMSLFIRQYYKERVFS